MDPLKLLSRSTRKKQPTKSARDAPSAGQNAQPQLFTATPFTTLNGPRKRKRHHVGAGEEGGEEAIKFFGRSEGVQNGLKQAKRQAHGETATERTNDDGIPEGRVWEDGKSGELSQEDCKRILKEHKLKVTWLNPPGKSKKERQRAKGVSQQSMKAKNTLVPQPLLTFQELRTRHRVGQQVVSNVLDQGYTTPTEVQMAALPVLLDDGYHYLGTEHIGTTSIAGRAPVDLLSVAPTGSGKTLAFMTPLIERLRRQRRNYASADRHTSAVVLAPTKELSAQIVNEGRKIARNTGIKVTQMRKGMKFGAAQVADGEEGGTGEGSDLDEAASDRGTVVKADIVVSTPGILQTSVHGSAASDTLSHVQYLVLDEADVLLDPLFKDQTLDIWRGLTSPDLRVSMWSATMGSNVEELARSTILHRMQGLQGKGQNFEEVPLIRLVVGLKDSAAPNVEHKLLYAASEQGKLMGLRQLLHPSSSSHEAGPTLRPPFLVFTQTIERAVALHSELRYDIPAEAGGINRIAVLHADLSTTARDDVMTRFRKGSIWVLITTDLLSRGVDFRGVNGVVNYDIPGSSAAYIHRIGRTGRAGREGGIAVTLYSKEDMPYLKPIANVMAMAQRQRGEETSDTQKWLLDALPKLSKSEKQALKRHGVKSRTAKGQECVAKGSRKSKISTKAGYVRRAEHRQKGAADASRRKMQADSSSDDGDDVEFAGFD